MMSGGEGILGFKRKNTNFALPLPNSIRVVRKILDLYVLVRIQVGQQVTRDESRGFCFCGSEPSSLGRTDAETKLARRSRAWVTWVM
jgi:hypothetical protein